MAAYFGPEMGIQDVLTTDWEILLADLRVMLNLTLPQVQAELHYNSCRSLSGQGMHS